MNKFKLDWLFLPLIGIACVLALWSFSDDAAFTRRLAAVGMQAKVHRVDGDRSSGRGRHHWIWVARAPGGRAR
jgi:hypothetical protein